ncbi:protocadherin alpha-10-like isoform X1 [Ambystoma mexicanum]|uniref:protocadherin alpha-10-like isoform X1 n=1 Tax=Ambystoma mexicanum TaxID=8296 RepID=UPI0037E8FD3C
MGAAGGGGCGAAFGRGLQTWVTAGGHLGTPWSRGRWPGLLLPGMGFAAKHWILPGIFVFTGLLLCCRGEAAGPVRYSVLEESGVGTAVGNIAHDLGVNVRDLHGRKFRMNYESKTQYFEVNIRTGALLTKEIIDREALCGTIPSCVLNLEVLMDNPLEFHRLEVEIVDINDNAPLFATSETRFTITELTLPGAHFPLEGAFDPDVGTNALHAYHLSPSEFFTLEADISSSESKSLMLVLAKALDREQIREHHLTITAADGGAPKRSGTSEIIIHVQDVNDNPPVFDKAVYRLKVPENTPADSAFIKLNATDLDEGSNADIIYSFTNRALSGIPQLFSIDTESGEIRVRGLLDFEDSTLHELRVQAKDKGAPSMTAHCKVLVEIIDLNDNAPEIEVTSISSPVREDAQPGQVVALFRVTDKDSGVNGEVHCRISKGLPFRLETKYQNYYSLVIEDSLDREMFSECNITVFATDGGTPSLSTTKNIVVTIADVNDNPPAFSELAYVISIPENNMPGFQILQVTALDPDMGDNARVRYGLLENSIDDVPVLSLFSVHTETGVIFALQPFDFEKLQVLQFQAEARDYGSPSLSCKTNVTVFVQDQNDNPPTIFQMGSGNSASEDTVLVPRSASTGHMVTKIRAIDADSGHNAWLSYEFKESTITTSLRIGQKSGEISLRHPLGESYPERHELIIVVKDHGSPVLSTTTTLTLLLVEINSEVKSDLRLLHKNDNYLSNLNSHLIISIAFISSISIFCIILFTALHYIRGRNESGRTEKADFCPDGVGNWSLVQSQGQQYNLYLTTQSSECNLTIRKSRLMDPGSANGGVVGDLLQGYSSAEGNSTQAPFEPKHPNPDWRYSASLRAGVQSSVHMEESAVLRGVPGGLEQQWPTVSSATTEPEGGEVSPPVGAGVNSNSWTFKYGPANPKQPVPVIPPDFPDNFIIPGSPAIISIRQDQPSTQAEKGNFITFGKKEETKKKKKKKKGTKTTDKKEKGNSTTDNSDQ